MGIDAFLTPRNSVQDSAKLCVPKYCFYSLTLSYAESFPGVSQSGDRISPAGALAEANAPCPPSPPCYLIINQVTQRTLRTRRKGFLPPR